MTPVLLADIGQYFRDMAPADGAAWVFVIIGFVGQVVFGMRFFVQWLASERAGHSYIPKVFWYLSIVGGMLLFTYACSRKDPIIMMGQSTNLLVYVRNLMLIRKKRREREQKTAAGIPICTDEHCGKENPEGATFCAFCGKHIQPVPGKDQEKPADPDAS